MDLTVYDLVPPVETAPLEQQGVINTNVGVRTGAGKYVAKLYTRDVQASIRYEHRLLAGLSNAGLSFAVPAPIAARDGATLCHGAHGWYALAPWLPGARLDPRDLRPVELLGAAIGELQAALRSYPTDSRPGRPLFELLFAFPSPQRDPFALAPTDLGLNDAPPHDDLLRWWRDEARQLSGFVDGPLRALPRQLCHNGVTPANTLVEGDRVAAVLDFEFAAPSARALDTAMGLRMTMRVWENPEPWEAIRAFCRGYTRWASLTGDEIRLMPWLIRLRGSMSVLWWLRHPYGDASVLLPRITYLRNFVGWLETHEDRFVETLMRELSKSIH